jgi:hypothetical protein
MARLPQVDGRMMVMNIRWGQPNNLMYLRPWAATKRRSGGRTIRTWPVAFRQTACSTAAHKPIRPEILETFASAELYSEKFSASLCGFTCIEDIPIPANVHRYYTAGGARRWHGQLQLDFSATITTPAGQGLPPVDSATRNNALTYVRPIDHIGYADAARRSIPRSHAGARAQHRSGRGYPDFHVTVPRLAYHGDQAWPPFVYDFGPGEDYDQQTGSHQRSSRPSSRVFPVYGVKVNADGNEVTTGMPTVLGEAPLGTYVGWNPPPPAGMAPMRATARSVGQVFAGAGNSGGYWPFWDTQANRTAAGDPRLSLEERYGTHAGYVCVVTAAVNKAVQQRFLLPSDAPTVIASAAASNVLGPPFVPTAADIALGNSLCAQ